MSKRRYTHIQVLLPEIKTMLTAGKTQREVKEYFHLLHYVMTWKLYDNAMAENFFSILKTECIYRHWPKSFNVARQMIDDYIYFYNNERVQLV